MFIELSVDGTPILVNMNTVSEIYTEKSGCTVLYFNFSISDNAEQPLVIVDQSFEDVLELIHQKTKQ